MRIPQNINHVQIIELLEAWMNQDAVFVEGDKEPYRIREVSVCFEEGKKIRVGLEKYYSNDKVYRCGYG